MGRTQRQEKVVKATEYVEHVFGDTNGSSNKLRHYFVLLETDAGRKVITERLGNGRMAWVEDPDVVDDRCSLAKITRSKDSHAGVLILDINKSSAKFLASSPSAKRFAQAIFFRAIGSQHSDHHVPYKDPVINSNESKTKDSSKFLTFVRVPASRKRR